MYNVVIGIDPDLHSSGVARVVDGKLSSVEALPIWKIFTLLDSINYSPEFSLFVRIEDGNLGRSANWHGGGKRTAANVGKNQAIATILREYCEANKIKHECIAPCGFSKTFKNDVIFKQATGWEKQTNEDSRAAVAIVYSFIKSK